MIELLKQYKDKAPEIVFEWNDSETDAQGWIVINSLRGGAAGGGTRMRKGVTKEEVLSLAKVMEIKFSVCGPAIGGAKSGINFDPRDPRKEEVLSRWYKAVMPLLKTYYGTGGDMNVDEVHDVIPITESYGLWHPQEGIVVGHFQTTQGERLAALARLRQGVSGVINDSTYVPQAGKYVIADMITGFGVSQSVGHYYDLFEKGSLEGKRAIIQGWGNVASAAAYYLARWGVKIVGIIDKDNGILAPEGLSFEEVQSLFENKAGNKLSSERATSFDQVNEQIWDLGAEIFIPAAASKIVSKAQMDRMIAKGLEVVSCGANVPFTDDAVFFGPTAQEKDAEVAIIPDFIANSGMARVFAYLMQPGSSTEDSTIFEDVSTVIKDALIELKEKQPNGTLLCHSALEIALKKLI